MPEYLDFAASTPVDERVLKSMVDVYQNHFGNAGSRTHLFGEDCRKIVEDSRRSIASLVGASPDEVIFTSGATESDNLAIQGIMKLAINNGHRKVVTSSIEHKAVLNTVKNLSKYGATVSFVDPDENGIVNPDSVADEVDDTTGLVSIMHVNNETGTIQPVEKIIQKVRERNSQVPVHIDAAQSAGKLVDELKGTDYDLLSVSAHKMYGPQGVGALVIRKRRYQNPDISPIVFGGGQERGLRSGTLPVALIAGFGKAAVLCQEQYRSDYKHNSDIKNLFIDLASESHVKYLINGSVDDAVPSIVNVCFPGVSSEALMIAGKEHFSISNGSACNSNSYEPSYVLLSMGLSQDDALSSVRISWGRQTGIEGARASFQTLFECVKGLQ